MFTQIALGGLLMLATVLLAGVSVWAMEALFAVATPWLLRGAHRLKLILVVMIASLWVLSMITIDVWLWAIAFRVLGVFPDMEHAVYFALVSFTTLGFGDVLLPVEWRIFGSMAAANGLLNMGLMTAFMIETLRHFRVRQIEVGRG
ncbi:ion channel [Paracoccus salsus]|uniref:ion channel n=1 Tax=Paracoccus salsus TaxID=2911061 RepID=UPI001F2EDB9B|nr:ion channel [Paracoccus salsus]MCF3973374.1 ion channel [Paracoccus salsus]